MCIISSECCNQTYTNTLIIESEKKIMYTLKFSFICLLYTTSIESKQIYTIIQKTSFSITQYIHIKHIC